jgi:hypothetical protein
MTPTFIILAVLYYVACAAGSLYAFARHDGYITVCTAAISVVLGWLLLLPWLVMIVVACMLEWSDDTVLWRSKTRSARIVWDD